jgi:hypothetical protein
MQPEIQHRAGRSPDIFAHLRADKDEGGLKIGHGGSRYIAVLIRWAVLPCKEMQMAYDEGLARLIRDDLAGHAVREQKMFGGLCFLLNGNMVAGVYSGGGMYRIDKKDRAEALSIDGAGPITMGENGREMAGMVGLGPEAMADSDARSHLLGLALAHVGSLPAK